MKTKLFIVIAIIFANIAYIKAQQNIELKNPTENKEFNTNTTPFEEKRIEGLREEYNKFGNERRNINVKHGSYDHYNQVGRQQSIISNQDVVINRPQSATLNNSQNNYNKQNNGRKVNNTNETQVNYNTPMSVNQLNTPLATSTNEETTIETSDRQNISIGAGGVVNPDELPTNPYDPPKTEPIGDAVPFVVMLAALYAFIIRRKQ